MAKSKNLWFNLGAVVLAIVIVGGIVMMKQGRKEVDRAVLFVNPIEPTPTFAPESFPTLPPGKSEDDTEEFELAAIMTPQSVSPKTAEEAPEVSEQIGGIIAKQEQEFQNKKQANLVLAKTAKDVKFLWEEKINEMKFIERSFGRANILKDIQDDIKRYPSTKEKYTPQVIRELLGLDFSEIKSYLETADKLNSQQRSEYIGDTGRKLKELVKKLDAFMDQDAEFYFSKEDPSQLNPDLEKLLKEIEETSAKLEEEYRQK